MKILLLVRSYNRPDFLKATLNSLVKSDIDHCVRRMIYDDGSSDKRVKNLLTQPELIKVPGKEFRVVRGKKNLGCKKSFLKALHKANLKGIHMICSIDNDVLVRPNWIQTQIKVWKQARCQLRKPPRLLTGFNPSNAHLKILSRHKGFVCRESCGAVHWFFPKSMVPFIKKHWRRAVDWGVVRKMERRGMPLIGIIPGCVQHVGSYGLHAGDGVYDQDKTW